MSDRPVILFMFAGRRQNLEVNLPQIRRILAENPDVQFDLWNLARTSDDSAYLKTIAEPRINVLNTFAGPFAFRSLNKVWQHYADPRFRDHLFVKMDDDVVFIQTERFGEFVAAVGDGRILTAEVVNNGACTAFMPELWQSFLGLDIPLLDVHQSNEYARLAHEFMFDNWRDLISRPTGLADVETWLSINFIGMDWQMLGEVNQQIGRPSPRRIADREWRRGSRIGDEGAANMFPRAVMTGFTTAHLGFGPQKLIARQESEWCRNYAAISREHLAGGRESTPLEGAQR